MKRTITGWMMTEPGKPLEKRSFEAPALEPNEVLLQVAGCGLCHTDLAFLLQGIKTRAKPPLILGHEISGTVVETGAGVDPGLKGRAVLVPAVLPCGECALCQGDSRRICSAQIMPGNDRHGGFASHTVVPSRFLCPVPDSLLSSHELWELSIVSDALATPFQSARLAGLSRGDLAVCIGAGGIGIHGIQIAAAIGAKVIALDVDPGKLAQAEKAGAGATILVKGMGIKDIRARVREEAKRLGAPALQWKILETSGTKAGQETGFNLLNHGATLCVIGFTMDTLEVRLSNLMAFDARLIGNWGSDPVLYPEILDWLAQGRIQVKPYVESHPLADINAVVDSAHAGLLQKRAVLVP